MTTFSMDFDFTTAQNKGILKYLQNNKYQLLGFKGASGPNQLSVGVPTWFSMPFGNIFGKVSIDYTPKYKVYVFNRAQIAAYTTIEMEAISEEIELGHGLVFTPDGEFTSGTEAANKNSIALKNNRPAGTSNLTVGLAGLVNLPTGQKYLPFCAFTLTPQGSINMTPLETICLMAAQVNLNSGNVQAVASAPGCSFSFSDSAITYRLQVKDSTYEITNVQGEKPVNRVSSGTALNMVVNR
jgi:hypothetical protein